MMRIVCEAETGDTYRNLPVESRATSVEFIFYYRQNMSLFVFNRL